MQVAADIYQADSGELGSRTREAIRDNPLVILDLAALVAKSRGRWPDRAITRACAEEVGLLADQFGMVNEPEQTSTTDSELGTWRLFRGDADGFSIDLAVADVGQAAAVIVLISDPLEREFLIGEVLLPAIEAFRVGT